MRAFQRSERSIPPGKILEMVTLNSARALGQRDLLGQITPGFLADLIAVPCAGSTGAFEEIVGFDGTVKWMMIDGKSVDLVV
jgi:imidazolonepropionase-like amidohydrolase